MKSDAVYARYSSHAQDDSSSIEVQIGHCEKTLGGSALVYKDEAKTGRAKAGRTQLLQLIADAKQGKIRRICVWRFSRIGRNLAESAATIQELEDAGVNVISAMEGSDPLVRSIFLAMADHYSKELAINTRDGLAARFKQKGFCGGIAPFGYQIVGEETDRRITINEKEAEIIRQLVGIYLRENIGIKGLANRLKQMGIPTRRGARWCHTTIRAILLNSMLVGKPRFLRREMKLNRDSGRRVPKFREDPQVLEYTDPSLRIITDEQYARIQEMLQTRSSTGKTPRLPREVRTFTGLVFCGECGSPCYTCKSQNSKGTYHYITCGVRCRHGKEGCPLAGRMREDLVLEIIRRDFSEIFADSDGIIAAATERAMELSKVQQSDVVRIKGETADLDRKIGSLIVLLVDPEMDPAAKRAIGAQIGELQKRREDLHGAMGRLATEAGETTERLAGAIRQALDEARQSLAGITSAAEFNRWVSRFVGPFELRGDGTLARNEAGRMHLSHPTGDIAGARSLPGRVDAMVREAFWARRAA